MGEEGFFTEWKQGNTSYEKPRNPAFGGVFFCLVLSGCPEGSLIGFRQTAASVMNNGRKKQAVSQAARALPFVSSSMPLRKGSSMSMFLFVAIHTLLNTGETLVILH